nr:L-amino acid oxidase 4 [synthetic construct]
MADTTSVPFDAESRDQIFQHHARSVISGYTNTLGEKNISVPSSPPGGERVGILGAGIGGLYSALILQSLDVPFEIIEASNRVGGRLFTHKFPNGGKYDYYDVGAMRYPLPKSDDKGNYQPGVMQRVGQLFTYLGMHKQLIPYYFKSNKSPGFQYFNGVRARIGEGSSFDAPALGINSSLIDIGVTKIVNDAVGPFAQALFDDLQKHTTTGWDDMMKNDAYSTRSYFSFKYLPSPSFGLPSEHFSTRVINWLETFDKSTGWYDRGLTETVLEAIAFGEVGDGEVDWRCIDGGSHVLPDTIAAFLHKKGGNAFVMNASVTAIGLENPNKEDSPMVVVAGGQKRKYSHVISTLPLPVLRTVDLKNSKLDIVQSNALRKLQYGPSIKIGILFKEPWWTTGQDKNGEKFDLVGGQSYTDLPIRTVVYPSYGVNTNAPSNTLIASYCWTNDAERMGSLIGTGKKTYEEQLEHLVLSNLAAVHNTDYQYLKDRLVDVHSWDWNHNPLTMGAFAFFGPGDFQDLYTSLNRPAANGKLHFAGEALSVRHAWVVGALDSAWRAVYNYLYVTDPAKLPKFFELWGKNAEWFEQPGDGKEPNSDNSLLEKFVRRTHGTVSV